MLLFTMLPIFRTAICSLHSSNLFHLILSSIKSSVPYPKLYDADWIRFFLRTTTPSVELVPPKALAILNGLPMLKAFILWILIRDPLFRPSLDEVRTKGFAIKQSLLGQNICTRSKLPQTSTNQMFEYDADSGSLALTHGVFYGHENTKAARPECFLEQIYFSCNRGIFMLMTQYVDINGMYPCCAHKTCHYPESAVGQEKPLS